MVKRKQSIAEKSRPFTTVNLYLPIKISICGDSEMEKRWKTFFNKGNPLSGGEFILENFKRDLKVKKNGDLFDDIENSKYWDKQKMQGLMIKLKFPNIQGYMSFILDRAIAEKAMGVEDEVS